MDVDMNSTVTMDSLLKSYPSLQRIPDKDRVRQFVKSKTQNTLSFSFVCIRLNVVGLNMKYQLVLMPSKNISREKNINNY